MHKFPMDYNWWKEKLDDAGSIRALARELQTTRRTIRRYLKAIGLYEVDNLSTKELVSQLIAANKQLKQEKDRINTIGQLIYPIAEKVFSSIKVPEPVKRSFVSPVNLKMFLLRSDVHIGLEVNPQLVQGVNCYNFQIYQKRLQTLKEKVQLFWEQDHASLGLRKLRILYLGDIVENEIGIYKTQPFLVDLPVVEQVFEGMKEEIQFILDLSPYFEEIEIFCVWGNHGRVSSSHHPQSNWDYVFYKTLKIAFDNVPNINVYIAKGPSMIIREGRFNIFLSHGSNIKAWNGIPYYGIDRTVRRLNAVYNLPINFVFLGHFHQPVAVSDSYWVNGSMVGGTDFSINRLNLSTLPSQKLLYFSDRYGFNRESNLYLEEQVELVPDANGIYTPVED